MMSGGNHKEALLQCVEEKRPLFHRPLEELKIPILFMGSKQDEMCRNDLENEYQEMASILPNAFIHLFPSGGHPAIASNAKKTAKLIKNFINEHYMPLIFKNSATNIVALCFGIKFS